MNFGVTKEKGDFKWKSVYQINFRLNNCVIQEVTTNHKNQFTYLIKLDGPSLQKIGEIEQRLRKQLVNEGCFLKSTIKNEDLLSINLWLVRKQIKTDIMDTQFQKMCYSQLKKEQVVDIDFKIDSIWAHKAYYPNFIYKVKPVLIQLCE